MIGITEAEEWRGVVGHEEFYEVSSYGRVRSLDRISFGFSGMSYLRKGRMLKPYYSPKGYLMVELYMNKKGRQWFVHRLVAGSFLKDFKEELEVDHINRFRDDNRLENLRMVTRAENCGNRGWSCPNCGFSKGWSEEDRMRRSRPPYFN